MKKNKIQVESGHYYNSKYVTKQRWISYWYQINEILIKSPNNVLEIGVGNGTVSDYLKKLNINITTCDFDKSLKPDVVADVKNLPFKDSSFDLVLCAEVLEHLPLKDLASALKEIRRVTKKTTILSLPHFTLTDIYFGFKIIPYLPKKELTFKIDFPVKHKFVGEHYWEIGKKGTSLNFIKNKITTSGFSIDNCYFPKENPRHQFFVLTKTSVNNKAEKRNQ